MDSTRTAKKFQMIQNYLFKYKKLKQNLKQSENLNKQMKSELLKLGSQTNTLLISLTSISNNLTQLKSQLPQRQKELISAKQQLKRVQYKTQKIQIKQKQYEERGKKFQQMCNLKLTKNLTLNQKIQKLQQKLTEEKQRQKLIINEIKQIQASTTKQKEKENPFRSYRTSVVLNPCDEVELKILTNQSLVKKLRQQKQEVQRKNMILKSNINKLQTKINEIQTFLKENTSIPDYKQSKQTQIPLKNGKIPFLQGNNKLPTQIVSSLKYFDNMKSKTMLQPLVQKHTKLTELENVYVENLQENYLLISQLSKINTILQSEIVQENSKISTFAIKGKKYTEKHKKSLA